MIVSFLMAGSLCLKKINSTAFTEVTYNQKFDHSRLHILPKAKDMLIHVLLGIINHYFLMPSRDHSGQATFKMSHMTISMRHMSP